MTVLLYDRIDLEERDTKSYSLWKGCHITSYALAAIFGLLNFYFLFLTMRVFGDQCVLDPNQLVFKNFTPVTPNSANVTASPQSSGEIYHLPQSINIGNSTLPTTSNGGNSTLPTTTNGGNSTLPTTSDGGNSTLTTASDSGNLTLKTASDVGNSTLKTASDVGNSTLTTASDDGNSTLPMPSPARLEVAAEPMFNETVEIVNLTAVNVGAPLLEATPPLMLDLAESQFHMESYCDMPLYTPLLSTIFGMVWATLFIMCPAGGRTKSGLSEPWRILGPALVFSLVFVVFIGHNFFRTNSGLQQLCAQFYNVTNTTSCSHVMDAHIPPANVSVPASVAVTLTRAACAGAWACWAVACTLLLARCVAGADFAVTHTEVRLHADPSKKLDALLKQRKEVQFEKMIPLSSRQAATGEDSLTSEPTVSSELNTASFAPALNQPRNGIDDRRGQKELIELSYSPSDRT